MKKQLEDMFRAVLPRLDIGARMAELLSCERNILTVGEDLYDLSAGDLRVVAIGKAASEMAASFDTLVGMGRASGIVVPPHAPAVALPNFRYLIGSHPYPDSGSIVAAHAVLRMFAECDEHTLVAFLLSGGGSSLFEAPLSHDIDIHGFYKTLVTCGANIYEMNVLRKHFSAVKGGRLAVAAWPAKQVTLFVSDVPPGKDSTVASGPTMPDESTVAECRAILSRYKIASPMEEIQETPKPGDGHFVHSRYHCLASNADATQALAALAQEWRWTTVVDNSCDDWPVERASEYLLAKLRTMSGPACIISGGELSSPVTGDGIGGRNQAFVLDCAMRIANERIAVLSCGTDGIDGNSPAAGAVADGETLSRNPAARDYFTRCDSYTYFAALGDTIITGPTGNNVRDVRILATY